MTALARAASHGCACKRRACALPWKEEGGEEKRNGRKDGGMKMDREGEREANGRTRRREGRLQPTSHSSCVAAAASYNTDIHIGDGSSIGGRERAAGVTVTRG